MSAPTPTSSPFVAGRGGIEVPQRVVSRSRLWSKFQLLGVDSPGTIPRGGIRGFRRETGWDKQAGKGTQGATLILKTMPPCEGTITCELFTDQNFKDLDYFVLNALSIDPTKQKAEGLPIYHPSLSSIALTRVVVEYYTPPDHVGKGKYVVEIKMIEWHKPPPVSIVSTVATSAPDLPDKGVPLDPRLQSGQDDVAEALAEQATAP